ncbi:MAG: YkgJ family cysteine cluster protein [Ignavibacteria bacterium]|nr:YkgJ family cysteine cluster protein [Ignavibacteria bacterium]
MIEAWLLQRETIAAENKKFLFRLLKQNPKAVNTMADELHVEVFKHIDCLDCANCCKSIPPIVNATDSKRIASHLKLKVSDFHKKYLFQDEDGDIVINQTPCPFLGSDNKCSIYEVRPKSCREYPHTDKREFIKNIKLHTPNTFYCPAVFHIIEGLKQQFK